MEKPTKRETCIFLVVAALVIFAWLCRFFDIPWEGGRNPFRTGIYLSLYIYWGYTLHHRLIHPQVRHLLVSIAALMVFWIMARSVKYCLPDQQVDVTRYLWYLFYLPMLFIPTLAVLTALSAGMPEGKRLPQKYNILWFAAAALFLLVMTNDLHQLMFDFPDNGTPWTDDDYRYAAGYYAYAVYVTACNLTTFILLALKSRRPGSRRWILLPCVPLFMLLGYWLLYILNARWLRILFGDLTAFSCVMYAAAFELCIRCGLIRSNSGYSELFRVNGLAAQIADHYNTVCLSGPDAAQLTQEQIISARTQPLFLDNTTLLRSWPIRFGHVLWQEDVSELTEAIEQFEDNCQELAERNRLSQKRLEAEKEILSLQEQNRVSDLLHRETAGQITLADSLLTRYEQEPDNAERRRLLAGAAAVGAYIKRYGNLLLVCEKNGEADIADLTRCFEESFNSLELLDVGCLCSLPRDRMLPAKDLLRIYRAFEAALEDCLFDLRHVWVNGREREGQILVNIEFVCGTDLSRHAPEADAFSCDSGAARFTFQVQRGGAGV